MPKETWDSIDMTKFGCKVIYLENVFGFLKTAVFVHFGI